MSERTLVCAQPLLVVHDGLTSTLPVNSCVLLLKVRIAVQVGACRLECGTMARICEDIVVKNKDAVKELLVNRTPRPEFEQKLCNGVASACTSPTPPFTGTREDEEFQKADEEQLEMMKTMAQMEEQGMSGTVRLPQAYCVHETSQLLRRLSLEKRCEGLYYLESFPFGAVLLLVKANTPRA